MGLQWWGNDDSNGNGQTGQNPRWDRADGSGSDKRSCSELIFGLFLTGLIVLIAFCAGLGAVLTW